MSNNLSLKVIEIIKLVENCTSEDLNIAWNWKGYNEGLRFAILRVNEELNHLTVKLKHVRQNGSKAISSAQYILAQHHTAYYDLKAIILGCNNEIIDQAPAKDEWSVRQTFKHIVEGEWAFLMAIETGINRIKNKEEQRKFTDADWDRHFVERGGITDQIFNQPLPELLQIYEGVHNQVIGLFNLITDEELDWKIIFWEEELFTVRFRLHRFESHLRQHSIQIEETLSSIAHPFTEARKLCRLILNSLADVEGTLIGDENCGKDLIIKKTLEIKLLKDEIQDLLK